jgi:hypothetical protein
MILYIHIINNNHQGSGLKVRPKRDGRTVYKQILIDAKLKIRNGSQKHRRVGKVHYGGERPHSTAVLSKKKKTKKMMMRTRGRRRMMIPTYLE